MGDSPLQGLGVLVTRPAHQAEGLCRAVRSAGGEPIRFPVLAIADPADPERLAELLGRLAGFDLAIFISPNAVLRGLALVATRGGLPPGLVVAAVGKGSARELLRLGHPADLIPSGKANSEALLALPTLQRVRGKKIVVFRGEGGRDLLGDTLRSRGAQVEYAEVYRRVRPAVDTGPLLERWSKSEIGAVVITSNEGLRNLYTLMGEPGRHWLRTTPLVVVSERGAKLAAELGWHSEVLVASGAGDGEIIQAVECIGRLVTVQGDR